MNLSVSPRPMETDCFGHTRRGIGALNVAYPPDDNLLVGRR